MTTTLAKELPHDLLAEKSLLGCILIDASGFEEISDLKIEKDDFYHPQYSMVFDAVRELAMSNKPIEFVTVCSKLGDMGKLESLGGQSFVLDLTEDQVTSANVHHYAKIVKDKATLRKLIRAAGRIIENGMGCSGDVDDFISDVEAKLFKITNENKSGASLRKLNVCLKENLKELADDSRRHGEITGLSTGYRKLDEVLLGLRPGQLIIVASRPAMGKSSLALNIAYNCIEKAGLPVVFFSLEMMAPELSMRLLSSTAKVDSRRIRAKNFTDTDLRDLMQAQKKLAPLPFYINDQSNISLFDIQSQCRKIKAEQGLGLIMIDYLQLMKATSPNNPSREQQISEISRGLKNMAKELECPVVALSQLNRSLESRMDKRPMLSDLRESGSLEQDADVVMFIYRDIVYNPDSKDGDISEIIISKNRAGERATAKLSFVGKYTSFEEPSYSDMDRGMNSFPV